MEVDPNGFDQPFDDPLGDTFGDIPESASRSASQSSAGSLFGEVSNDRILFDTGSSSYGVEAPAPRCGIGFELALLMPLLMVARRRFRRSP